MVGKIFPENASNSVSCFVASLKSISSWFEDKDARAHIDECKLVERQSSDHLREDSPVYMLKNSSTEIFNAFVTQISEEFDGKETSTELSKRDEPEFLMYRDPVGACVFHIAYLLHQYEKGRMLVEKFPHFCLKAYDGLGPYNGETLLHMVIVRDKFDEVEFLLNKYYYELVYCKVKSEEGETKLLKYMNMKVTGSFFMPAADYKPKPKGVYYGDKAIHMAVCRNNRAILDLLLTYYRSLGVPLLEVLDYRDMKGNNVLHLCALYNLDDMYDYILSKFILPANNPKWFVPDPKKAPEHKKEELLSKVRILENAMNHENLTPFMLCAMYGNPAMFKKLIQRRKHVVWTFGPVTHYRVDLVGFDVPAGYNPKLNGLSQENSVVLMLKSYFSDLKNAISSMCKRDEVKSQRDEDAIERLKDTDTLIEYLASGKRECEFTLDPNSKKPNLGAIEHICAKDRRDMLALDDVKAIIDLKWQRVGFWMFLRRACYNLVVTVLLSMIVCTYNFQSASTTEGWVTWAYFPVVFTLLAFKFLSELPEILTRGISYWGWGDSYVRGAARLDNVCSTIEFLSFGMACFLKLLQFFNHLSIDQGDVPIRVLISISVLTSWVYLYFFLLGFTHTGTFVIIVSTILSKDIPVFFSMYTVVLCGFGSSFALTSLAKGGTMASGFNHFFSVLWSLFVYTVTGGNYDGFDGKFFPTADYSRPFWLYVILVAMFNLIILFLMLNLLVAMMSQTYESIFEESQQILYRERYNIMCSLERGFSDTARVHHGERYGIWAQDKHGQDTKPMDFKDIKSIYSKHMDSKEIKPNTSVNSDFGPQQVDNNSSYRFYFELTTTNT
jgi:ankyrin repeat protein